MQEFQEILNKLLSAESSKEYEKYLKKENVVDVAKKVYDAADSLRKMPIMKQQQVHYLQSYGWKIKINKFTSEQSL